MSSGPGFPCPKCSSIKTIVVDSRTSIDSSKRRRRRCSVCNNRFTTYETTSWNPKIHKAVKNLKDTIANLEKLL